MIFAPASWFHVYLMCLEGASFVIVKLWRKFESFNSDSLHCLSHLPCRRAEMTTLWSTSRPPPPRAPGSPRACWWRWTRTQRCVTPCSGEGAWLEAGLDTGFGDAMFCTGTSSPRWRAAETRSSWWRPTCSRVRADSGHTRWKEYL